MVAELVECVPNFSEGRRAEVIGAIREAIAAEAGVRILDTHTDPDHNRSVVSYVVPVDAAVASGMAAARAALAHIDLRAHAGVHPRIGALDVFPFVSLGELPMTRCVALAEELGERIATELGIPVYLYEAAARRSERVHLEQVRAGGFEGLRGAIGTDPERLPDFGPARVHPTAGAIAVGARRPLIAFNVALGTADPGAAKAIARAIRYSSGGLRHVKALGLALPSGGITQVSMNLTDYRRTGLVRVMDLIRAEAARWGVQVIGAEIVGLVPEDALLEAAEAFLGLRGFRREQILERRLRG